MRRLEGENSETGMLELDIMELPRSCDLLISEGKVKLAELAPYTNTRIKTLDVKVKRIILMRGEDI